MTSDAKGDNGVSLNVKDRPQIALNHDGMDCAAHNGCETVDFVRA